MLSSGQTFAFKFTTAGTFHYHCGPHSFMTGTVTVEAAANNPPAIILTRPINGSRLFAPALITVEASASDTDGSVSQVEFFNGISSIGVDAASPFSVTVSNLAVGTYTLTAKATDNQGAATTSAAATVTVMARPTVTLLSSQRPANGQFRIEVGGIPAGLTAVLQTSNDLISWSSTQTNVAAGGPFSFTDPKLGTTTGQFYRVLVTP